MHVPADIRNSSIVLEMMQDDNLAVVQMQETMLKVGSLCTLVKRKKNHFLSRHLSEQEFKLIFSPHPSYDSISNQQNR